MHQHRCTLCCLSLIVRPGRDRGPTALFAVGGTPPTSKLLAAFKKFLKEKLNNTAQLGNLNKGFTISSRGLLQLDQRTLHPAHQFFCFFFRSQHIKFLLLAPPSICPKSTFYPCHRTRDSHCPFEPLSRIMRLLSSPLDTYTHFPPCSPFGLHINPVLLFCFP